MALLYYELKDYDNVIKYSLEALKIKTHPKTYINEVFSFDNTLYDILSIAYYYKNEFNESLKYVLLAIEMDKNNERLLNNKKLITDKLK